MDNPKVVTALRIILGGIFLIFGLNYFLGFMTIPQPTGNAAAFMGGLAAASYFFPLLKATQVICGALLLLNRYVPLALVILAPIVLNIALFHSLVAPEGLPLALVVLVCTLGLANANKDAYSSLLEG